MDIIGLKLVKVLNHVTVLSTDLQWWNQISHEFGNQL